MAEDGTNGDGTVPNGPDRPEPCAGKNGEETTPTNSLLPGPEAWAPVGSQPVEGYPQPGSRWGDFLILEELDAGGQARVFLVSLAKAPGDRQFVLKVPRAPRPSAAASWPNDEIRALLQLEHPNIGKLKHAGEVSGLPYLTMEYVRGLPLGRRREVGPPSPGKILRWMIPLGEAVRYAHGKGVAHRDLKPQNVIITEEDERPILIDFGLSSTTSPYRPEHRGGKSGTYAYMAPEVASHGWKEQDAYRADLFSLGGVLKFLLDGAGPYEPCENYQAAAEAGAVQPARRSLWRPGRCALAAIANRALQADPRKRFAGADGMAKALRRVRNGRRIAVVAVACAAACAAAWPIRSQLRREPPLRAAMEIHLQRAGETGAYHVLGAKHLLQSGLLPLRSGDRIQVHAELSQPMAAYLVAVSSSGQMRLLYPPDPRRAPAVRTVAIPPGRNQWLPLVPPGGTETVLLLARREPLDRPEDLLARLRSYGAPPELDGAGLLVVDEDGIRIIQETYRLIGGEPVTVEKGLLPSLVERMRKDWPVIRAVGFAHVPAPAASSSAAARHDNQP